MLAQAIGLPEVEGGELFPHVLAHEILHHRPEAVHGVLSGGDVGATHVAVESVEKLRFQCCAGSRQPKQALTSIGVTDPLCYETLFDQFAQHAAEGLLGNAQEAQQVADGQIRLPPDEVQAAMMCPAQAHGIELRIGMPKMSLVGE
jgi:hypothetical protein